MSILTTRLHPNLAQAAQGVPHYQWYAYLYKIQGAESCRKYLRKRLRKFARIKRKALKWKITKEFLDDLIELAFKETLNPFQVENSDSIRAHSLGLKETEYTKKYKHIYDEIYFNLNEWSAMAERVIEPRLRELMKDEIYDPTENAVKFLKDNPQSGDKPNTIVSIEYHGEPGH